MTGFRKESIKEYLWFAGVVITAGIVYLKTVCPTVEFIDSGELAANCYLLGIPHPTGYPLYVLLGRLAVLLLPGEIIFRCNLLSLICTAISTGLLFLITISITAESKYKLPVAASISLFVAFSSVWWSQGTSNEVYCITLMADLLAILFLVKYSNERKQKFLIAAIYIWGLSFGSHMSSIFLLLSIVYLIYSIDGYKGIFKPHYRWAILFFLIAVSVYIYLPVRAAFKPFLNWSNPANLDGLINHISGWQYRVWMFSSLEQTIKGISYFLELFFKQFGIAGIALITIGIISVFRENRKISLFLLFIILADIIYSSSYEITDIDSYYLIGFAGLAVFAGSGLCCLIGILQNNRQLKSYKKLITIFIVFVLIALPASNLLDNYLEQDKSNKRFAVSGVENILASMDTNGLAIIENWDYYSPWLYFRYVLNIRPDLVLIDKELMRRSWYMDFLQRYHPAITNKSEKQIKYFLKLLEKFESGDKYDSRALDFAYKSMIASIINLNASERPVYTNILKDPDIVTELVKVPAGVLYKFENDYRYVDFDIGKIDFSGWETSFMFIDKRTRVALSGLSRPLTARIGYCQQFGYIEEAQKYSEIAGRINNILSGKSSNE